MLGPGRGDRRRPPSRSTAPRSPPPRAGRASSASTCSPGSFAERVEGHEKLSNTSVLIGPDGAIRGVYRKIHMFDVDVGGVSYRESEPRSPGDEIVVADAGGVPVGMTVCYDLRFPELYRILALAGRAA